MPQQNTPPKPPTPKPPVHPQPNPKGPKRRIHFEAESMRDAAALTYRLMDQGISVDRMGDGTGGAMTVKAIADPTVNSKKTLPQDMAKGLGVEVISDKTDPTT